MNRVEEVLKEVRAVSGTRKRELVLLCDHCGSEFTRSYNSAVINSDRPTFCSLKCSSSSTFVKNKVKQTCLERYGVDHPWKAEVVRDKQRATMKDLYGGINVFNSPVLRQRVEETMVERYGAGHPMHVDSIKEKLFETNVEKYGFHVAMHSESGRKKSRATSMKNWGVPCPTMAEENKAKIDYVESNRKRRETLLREGRLWTSKPEAQLGEWLVVEFGECDVKRQSWIARRSIDYYVVSLDVYVELDGVYPHGLMGEKHVNEVVKKKIASDGRLNEWFHQNQKRLFRMTDMQWYEVVNAGAHAVLKEQLSSSFVGVKFFDFASGYRKGEE